MAEPKLGQLRVSLFQRQDRQGFGGLVNAALARPLERLHVEVPRVTPDHVSPQRMGAFAHREPLRLVAEEIQQPDIIVDTDTGVENPCGIDKSECTQGPRQFGGLLTAILGCGIVAYVALSAGHESVSQLYGMLGEIYRRRRIRFVVYDNACFFARYARCRSRRLRTHADFALASLTYVLDRWHQNNHVACLDPQHRFYMPEVNIAQYPELTDLPTTYNETWNSFIDGYATHVQSMHPATLGVFKWLLADLWNVRKLRECARVHEAASASASTSLPRPSHLKRRAPD